MRDILRRVMHSRVMWFVCVIVWARLAAGLWYQAAAEGFSAVRIVQVVLATGLGAVFVGAFLVNRAWRKHNDDAR